MGKGIDQRNLHSVQPGYLKILQMGLSKNRIARPVHQLANQIKPLYHAQPISRWKSSVRDHRGPSAHHSSVVDTPVVTTPMIALDISGTTHQSASHNITQSTAELTADATSFHKVQKFTAAGFLELKSVQGTNNKIKVQNSEECSPKSLNPQDKRTAKISPKASNASNSTLPDSALIQGLKWVAIERAKLGEFNATKIIKNRGWKRRESAMESYGEQ
ncbi:hypothetical protein F511_25017 [Dorcoceras hygrometricum]|uniref:Uncharacterized protein n=1 Tax=Dorcoceras hygrometricum TaxID=472368 RepID=A0A2Z7CGS3_9LAMI|nr:hypothetical protein F511_25017 [Dorcoceras hygrometricum]